MRDSFEIIKAMGVSFTQVRSSGGGGKSKIWRQIMADVTGEAHWTINVDEGPAFGVALLAGVGAGVWGTVPEACAATIKPVENVQPDPAKRELYDEYYALYQDLYQRLEGAYTSLSGLLED